MSVVICENCGKTIDKDSKFCSHCGYSIVNKNQELKGNYRFDQRFYPLYNKINGPIKDRIRTFAIIEASIGLCLWIIGSLVGLTWIITSYYSDSFQLNLIILDMPFFIILPIIFIILLYGTLFYVFSYGLYHQKKWGKDGSIILLLLLMIIIPIGTIVGGLMAYFLTKSDNNAVFS